MGYALWTKKKKKKNKNPQEKKDASQIKAS